MIDSEAARELVAQIRRVEDQLERLLVSGWRLGQAEAMDLQRSAQALDDADLPALAARLRAVAQAAGPSEALQAIALTLSAARLLRLRLPDGGVPDGWSPLQSRAPARQATSATLTPLCRLSVDGREVWCCAWPARGQWLLLEPPTPSDNAPGSSMPASTPMERFRRQLARAFDGGSHPPSHWLRRRLHGELVWRARYPVGAGGDVAHCALKRSAWVKEHDERDSLEELRQALANDAVREGGQYLRNSGLTVLKLDRDDSGSFAWLDPTAEAAFSRAATGTVWALAWTGDGPVVPLALLRPGRPGRPPHVTHLIPESPSDIIAVRP